MKKLRFIRTLDAYQDVTITINDEEKFKEFCKEWIEQGQTLNFWDLYECDTSIITVDEGPIDWNQSNEDNFYEVMMEHGFPTDEEELTEPVIITFGGVRQNHYLCLSNLKNLSQS